MAEPIEEAIEFFIKQVFGNDTLSDEQRKEYVSQALRSLAGGITDGKHRWGLSMSIGSLGRDAGVMRKKKEASGFFGNWAKHSIESKDKKEE